MIYYYYLRFHNGNYGELVEIRKLFSNKPPEWSDVNPIPDIFEDVEHFTPFERSLFEHHYDTCSYDELEKRGIPKNFWEAGELVHNLKEEYGTANEFEWIQRNWGICTDFNIKRFDYDPIFGRVQLWAKSDRPFSTDLIVNTLHKRFPSMDICYNTVGLDGDGSVIPNSITSISIVKGHEVVTHELTFNLNHVVIDRLNF